MVLPVTDRAAIPVSVVLMHDIPDVLPWCRVSKNFLNHGIIELLFTGRVFAIHSYRDDRGRADCASSKPMLSRVKELQSVSL